MSNLKNRNILCVITARGGSERVLRKNGRDLGGEPLIAYAIRAALAVEEIDRVIVSTDDDEIAEVAKQYGAEVPFKRPDELATSDCPTYKVLQHALDYVINEESFNPEMLVLVQPTSPFVTPSDIQRCLIEYDESNDFDLIAAAYNAESNHVFYVDERGYFKPVCGEQGPLWHDAKFILAGSVYVYRASIINSLTESLTEKTGYCLVDKSHCIDIDTEDDLSEAQEIISSKTSGSDS